ncbi:MAG: aminotransferase class III-fold pyridoxal phosphate-dependent enzyme [Ilumatobacteraceae bacterium]
MKTVAIVQARMGSTRFPNKVMGLVTDLPLIEVLLRRLSLAKSISEVVVATSTSQQDDVLVRHVEGLGYSVFRGSESNVLDRYYQAAKKFNAEVIVRVTGDCPLIDPSIVDEVVGLLADSGADFASNTNPPTFPDGLDSEVFTMNALEIAHTQANTTSQLEHVTTFFTESEGFRKTNLRCATDHSQLRWTVDEPADLEVVRDVFGHFAPRQDFSWTEVVRLFEEQPDLFSRNKHLARNEGAKLNTGQKLWKRAKGIIPGGNMLLSKRSEMFLPDQWPAYFSKAKGCHVWDLDGREFIDMSLMGIGTNILGYGHPEVDDAVRSTVDAGNMTTLNCPEEVYLAERLIELHPWADMVRLARSGGEANAVAIRIARAAAGKSTVAICGYHGWHDWYLAANLGNDEILAGHLLPGLQPNGVPESLRGTVVPFNYNDIDELVNLVSSHNVGVIMMEVSRSTGPTDDFLHKVRDLATRNRIVLMFDECTSGFRQTYGGLHKMYGVEPDMAMFGKALGNGYAITAVIGRREIMQAAQTSFISSTFWTERIGPTAALKTLEVMNRLHSWDYITETGREITNRWVALADKFQLDMTTSGLPALTSFAFAGKNSQAYKTLITQEMLAHGFLATTSIYVCIEHTPSIIDGYFDRLESIFATIQECEHGRDVFSLLNGPVCDSGFRRLN